MRCGELRSTSELSAAPSPPPFRPPHETVTADRCKANVAWVALLGGVIFWVVKLVACNRSQRLNPPVRIYEKAEPFGFPDVALCPTAGGGCDAGDPLQCLEGMQLFVSALSVLWSDEVAETPVSSTRQFINTFLVGEGDEDDDLDSENAVATLARLPYDRISVDATNASESITVVSNDVVTTTGQQSLQFDNADPFSGAILFATFSINEFSFQTVEELDTSDYVSMVGAAGGMLVIVYALFGLLFAPSRSPGPRRIWRFSQRRRRRRSKLDFRPADAGADDAISAAATVSVARRQSI
ncbi:hypothetical protein Esi_0022_0075 [Ectocarpus siliculosus]|uniref:Uncharacterized protein n=1 Tax=Ectocarpus siliculosus TaxID=2880 RepID=D8LIE9_ECTSI|nr:hypothetical protein Esi_0022_0075 [Ectocarpus siliculosus]|eukprot:CBN79988.1 hypothetical protein Esi_0022_0075 [Ectocarpus siliculosus]